MTFNYCTTQFSDATSGGGGETTILGATSSHDDEIVALDETLGCDVGRVLVDTKLNRDD